MEKFKLTDEIKTNFLKAMEEKGFDALFKSIKEVSDEETGVFEVIITTDDMDRMGEIINLDGWEIDNYMKNPVVLWGHDHYKMPIGICTGIERVSNGLKARGKFAPGEEGQQVRSLYDLGVIRATSVGFIEKERQGNIITKAELIEFSFVSVPANPMALSTLIKSNINVNELVTKGFIHVETKEEEKVVEETEEEKTAREAKEQEDANIAAGLNADGSPKDAIPADDTPDDDGEKMVKISKSKLASIRLALKEAGDVLEEVDESTADDSAPEDIKDDADTDPKDDEEESSEEKAFRLFTEGRRHAQVAATALAESLAEMRKSVESKK